MHFTNDDMKNQIIGNDGNVYELDVRGGQPSEEKDRKEQRQRVEELLRKERK